MRANVKNAGACCFATDVINQVCPDFDRVDGTGDRWFLFLFLFPRLPVLLLPLRSLLPSSGPNGIFCQPSGQCLHRPSRRRRRRLLFSWILSSDLLVSVYDF